MPQSKETTLSPAAITKLKAIFQDIDRDGSGVISIAEFTAACDKLSIVTTEEETKDFYNADESGNDGLCFDEFCNYYRLRLWKAFSEIDVDSSGEITVEELQKSFEKLGFQATLREVHSVLREVDKDHSKTVDFHEFCDFFCSLPSPNLRSIIEKWASGLSVDTGTDLAPPPLPPPSVPIWRALVAGGLAGVVSRTATAPLETIKIIAQTSTTGRIHIASTFSSIWKNKHWRGIFAGNGANCLRVLPFSAFVCLAYANLARHFPLDHKSSPWNPVWRMGAGAFAGMFATVLTHPMDVIRAKLTVQSQSSAPGKYRGLFHGLVSVGRSDGLPGLYRGLGPTLLAIAPFMAVQQATYDVIKHKATSRRFQPSPLLFLLCGSVAGATAQTVVYPLDVMRRRMQVHNLKTHAWALLKSMPFRELFAGLTATYLKVMPAAAISLLVRDALLGRLQRK